MKTVSHIMSQNPCCCSPDTPLHEVAQMMVDHCCGCIPVVEAHSPPQVVGVLTDRDIMARSLAQGRNPLEMTARDVMTTPAVTLNPDCSLEECAQIMEENLIRRVPIVNEQNQLCGIVSQADLALKGSEELTAEVVCHVSRPTEIASMPAAGEAILH